MNYYIVTFDLHVDDNKTCNDYYSMIEEYLQSFRTYVKPTNNVYLVSSNSVSSVDIRDRIKYICQDNCYVLVMGLNGVYASYNLEDINKQLADYVG